MEDSVSQAPVQTQAADQPTPQPTQVQADQVQVQPTQPATGPGPTDPATSAKKLYDGLMSLGVTKDNIGDYNQFSGIVNNPDRASKLYDGLISLGVSKDNIGSKDDFLSKIAPAKPFTPVNPIDKIPGVGSTPPPVQSQLSFVKDPAAKQHMLDQQVLDDTHEKNVGYQQAAQVSESLKNLYNGLSPAQQKKFDESTEEFANATSDAIRATPQSEQNHWNFMNNTITGRILGMTGTVASDITHGVVDIGVGSAFLLTHGAFFKDQTPDWLQKGEDAANKFADLGSSGLTENDRRVAHDTPILGVASQVAPIEVTEGIGMLTKLPKAMFFLQFTGSGIKAINDIKKTGVTVDPLVENVFPLLSGAVGSLSMGNVGETLFGKLSSEAGGKLASAIGAETFMEAAQKNLSEQATAELLSSKTQTYLQKLEIGSLNLAETYKQNLTGLAKFQIGNYLAKKAADIASDSDGYKKPFNANIGDLANSLYGVITKDAPIFAGLSMGTLRDAYTMAAPHTGFKNEIVQSILKDSSPDSVDELKGQMNQYSAGTQGGSSAWTPEQLQGTYDTIDKIAKAANVIPKKLKQSAREKALSIIVGRNELRAQMDASVEQNGNVDEDLKDVKTPDQLTVQNKIDQANDKVKAIIMGGAKAKVKYGTSDSGSPFKEFPDGTIEKITQSRYDMEQNEKSAKSTTLYKESNPIFLNYAKSVGVTEDSDHADSGLSTDNKAAVDVKLSPDKHVKDLVYVDHIHDPAELGLEHQKLEEMGQEADKQNVRLAVHAPESEPDVRASFREHGFEGEGDIIERKPNLKVEDNESTKPTEDQTLDDLRNKRFSTFKYSNKSDIPEIFKDKEPTEQILTDKKGNKKTEYIITVPKSEADYLLSKNKSNEGNEEIPSQIDGESGKQDSVTEEAGANEGTKVASKKRVKADANISPVEEAGTGIESTPDAVGKGEGQEDSGQQPNATNAGTGDTAVDGIKPEPISDDELTGLKKEYLDTKSKLNKTKDPNKKIEYQKTLNGIEAKISASNEAKFSANSKPISGGDNGVSAGKMAAIDQQISDVSSRLGKNLRKSLSANGSLQNVGDLIELGKLYIQKGVLNLGEFIKRLRADYMDATGKELKLTDREIASQVYKPAVKSFGDPNSDNPVAERGFGKRLRNNDDLPEETKTYVDTDPDHDYQKQVIQEIKDDLEIKATEELLKKMEPVDLMRELGSDTNVGVLAAAELLKRALVRGDDVEYTRIFKILDAAGTSIGQMLRQFAEIKGSTPEFFISALEKKLEISGRFLTPEQKSDLHDLMLDYFKKSIKAKDSWLHAIETLDDEDKRSALADRKEADMAHISLEKKLSSFDIAGFWDTAITIMKGNLLSISSQLANPVYNIMFAPLRLGSKFVAAGLDKIASAMFGTERTIMYNKNQVSAQISGLGVGLREAGLTFAHGIYPNSETKVGDYRGLKPLDAWVQIFTGKDIPKSNTFLKAFNDRFLTKPLEALLGGPAELMYRSLGFGDKPFYRSAYQNELTMIGNLKGLSGDDMKRFMMNPDPGSHKQATQAADEATFQQDSPFTKSISRFVSEGNKGLDSVPVLGGMFKFALSSIMPFIKTPTNVIVSGLDYLIPEVSLAKSLVYTGKMISDSVETKAKIDRAIENGASKATIEKLNIDLANKTNQNRKDLLLTVSKGIVARSLRFGAAFIVGNGLFTGSLEDDKKKRGLQYEAGRPNSVNVTALMRGMQTGDYSWRPGTDDLISLDKFGMFGAAIAVESNIKESEETNNQQSNWLNDFTASAPAVVKNSLDQSFLKGVNGMMDAFATGRFDQIASNMVSSMSAVILPNTWSAFARANREFMVNKKGGSTAESIEDVIKEKALFNPNLPHQVGLWGQDVKQNPDGRNPYIYQLLDITKFNTLADDPVTNEVLNLYKRTGDDSFIPQAPDGKYMINGVNYTLTPEELMKRQQMVGQARYSILFGIVNSPGFKNVPDHIKAMGLSLGLTQGTSDGNMQFEQYYIEQHPDFAKKIIGVKTGVIKNK